MGEERRFVYRRDVLEHLIRHGVSPTEHTPPTLVRDFVRDLYKYEIRRLRTELLAGRIVRKNYAGHVIALRRRYWLLSVPVHLWLVDPPIE